MTNLYAHLDTATHKDGWVILAPGGGGCVHLLTVNPHRPDTAVVSCDMTAGYITHDGGKSWREFNLKSRQYAYAFDPVDPDAVYVGTSGLFRSEDNGCTWRLIFPDPKSVTGETRVGDEANHTFLSNDNWPGGVIHAILIDPDDPRHITIVIKKDGLQVYLSEDRGKHWEKLAAIKGSEIHRLVVNRNSPVNARDFYAFTEQAVWRIPAVGEPAQVHIPEEIFKIRHASYGINPQTGKQVFYITAFAQQANSQLDCGVWKSTDLGASWQRMVSGLEPLIRSGIPGDLPIFSQISACERDARCAYLIAEKFPEFDTGGQRIERYGILKSCDEGCSWEWVVKMDDGNDPPNRIGGWAERDYGAKWGDIKGDEQITPKGRFAWDVVASPVSPDVCYTMDFSTIFKTKDGGASWEQLCTNLYPDGSFSSRGIDVLSNYGVIFDPFNPEHLALVMSDVGILHSFNSGRTWHHAISGVPRTWINNCYWLVYDPEVKGRAWSVFAAMHDIPRSKEFRDELLAKFHGGVCKSEDGLQTWHASSLGLPEHAIPTHIVLDPASPAGNRTLYITLFNGGVYKSTNDGQSWVPKNKGIDPANLFAWRLTMLPDGTIYLVVVRNQMPGRDYPGDVYKSEDGAEHWEKLSLPEGVIFPNDITFDPSDPECLYLSCWPRTIDGEERYGGLYASSDGGKTWALLFDSSAHVYAVTVDEDNPATLYMATFDVAAYRSDDRGKNWKRLKGFNFQWCHRPIPDPYHPEMLYLATFGSSVWYGPAKGVDDAVEDIVE